MFGTPARPWAILVPKGPGILGRLDVIQPIVTNRKHVVSKDRHGEPVGGWGHFYLARTNAQIRADSGGNKGEGRFDIAGGSQRSDGGKTDRFRGKLVPHSLQRITIDPG